MYIVVQYMMLVHGSKHVSREIGSYTRAWRARDFAHGHVCKLDPCMHSIYAVHTICVYFAGDMYFIH